MAERSFFYFKKTGEQFFKSGQNNQEELGEPKFSNVFNQTFQIKDYLIENEYFSPKKLCINYFLVDCLKTLSPRIKKTQYKTKEVHVSKFYYSLRVPPPSFANKGNSILMCSIFDLIFLYFIRVQTHNHNRMITQSNVAMIKYQTQYT